MYETDCENPIFILDGCSRNVCSSNVAIIKGTSNSDRTIIMLNDLIK